MFPTSSHLLAESISIEALRKLTCSPTGPRLFQYQQDQLAYQLFLSEMIRSGDCVLMKISRFLLPCLISSTLHADDLYAQMAFQDMTFQVESPNNGLINSFTVRAGTADGSIGTLETEADGTITNVELPDLNANHYPGIYIYANSAGISSYGSLIV
jgi:hypothetical protein